MATEKSKTCDICKKEVSVTIGVSVLVGDMEPKYRICSECGSLPVASIVDRAFADTRASHRAILMDEVAQAASR